VKKILIVGIGNFGSWWIISLAKIKFPLKIYCYDLDPEKYILLKKKFDFIPNLKKIHEFFFLDRLSLSPIELDLIIVSTNADVRLKVIQELSRNFKTKKWIIEKVIAQSPDQLRSLMNCLNNQNAYVNHSRRLQPSFNFCHSILQNKPLPNRIKFLGGHWELASNSFHLVDLISYWFQTSLVKIDTGDLNSEWHLSSTRKGFFDIGGLLRAYFDNGLELHMNWSEGNDSAFWTFEYANGEIQYNEITGEFFENKKVIAKIPMLNFSELDQQLQLILIEDENHENNLPNLIDVYNFTFLLLDAFLEHWKLFVDSKSKIVPIS
jgi:hypothetical protein